jgi:hypothetical protein
MHSFDDAMLAIGASAERIRCLLDSFAHSSTLPKLQGILGTELVCAACSTAIVRFYSCALWQAQSEFGSLHPNELSAALNSLKLAQEQ